MKFHTLPLLILLLLPLHPPSAWLSDGVSRSGTAGQALQLGQTYYVDLAGGDDSNTGQSEESAWRTLARVNATPFSGSTTVLFKRGEIWRGEQLVVQSGVRYADYGSGPLPVLDAQQELYAAVLGVNVTRVALANLDLRNGTSHAAVFDASSGISITDCEMSGAGNDNLLIINGSHDILVRGGRYFAAAEGGGHSGIEIADGSSNVTIEGVETYANPVGITIHNHPQTGMPTQVLVSSCSVHDNHINGIQIGQDGPGGPVTLTLQDCTISNNANDGVQIAALQGNYVHGTILLQDLILYGNGYRNLYIQGDDVSLLRVVSRMGAAANNRGIAIFDSLGLRIAHLTLYAEHAVGYSLLRISGARTDRLSIQNSILASRDGQVPPIEIVADVLARQKSIEIDWNLYSTLSERPAWQYAGSAWSFSDWQAGGDFDRNSPPPGDPGFVDPDGGDFTLLETSAAIDAGQDIGLPYAGQAPDLGAFEHSPANPLVRPQSSELILVLAGIFLILTLFVLSFLWIGKTTSKPINSRKE